MSLVLTFLMNKKLMGKLPDRKQKRRIKNYKQPLSTATSSASLRCFLKRLAIQIYYLDKALKLLGRYFLGLKSKINSSSSSMTTISSTANIIPL